MRSTESAPVDTGGSLSPKYERLLNGPASDNYNLRQLQLAAEQFLVGHPDEHLTDTKLDEIVMAWSDVDSPTHYSEFWRQLVSHPDFKTHPRFQGHYSKVALRDLETFIQEGQKKLPE